MKKDQINILKDRGIISIVGKDAKEFLQNIITNNISNVNKENSGGGNDIIKELTNCGC